jgi:hypothetical protein
MLELFLSFGTTPYRRREIGSAEVNSRAFITSTSDRKWVQSGQEPKQGPDTKNNKGRSKGPNAMRPASRESSEEIHAPAALPLAEVTIRFNSEELWDIN